MNGIAPYNTNPSEPHTAQSVFGNPTPTFSPKVMQTASRLPQSTASLGQSRKRGLTHWFALSLLFLVSLFAMPAQAGVQEISNVIHQTSIGPGALLKLTDPMKSIENTDPSNFRTTRRNLVRLDYHRSDRSDVAAGAAWDYEVEYRTYAADFVGNLNNLPTRTLKVSFGAGQYVYEAINEEGNFYNPVVEILNVNSTGPVPDDIQLELIIERESYRFLDPVDLPFMHFNASTGELSWKYVEGAEEYDVEWVFIDAQSAEDFNNNPDGSQVFDFKRGTRIRTDKHSYQIDMTYYQGQLFFRTRAVGRYINGVGTDYSKVKLGDWAYTESVLSTTPLSYVIGSNQAFEPNKNWTYQIGFTEHGRENSVVSYSDGSGRGRQSLTAVDSKGVTLIGESKYDEEGRASVSILPAPMPGNSLHYRTNFNISGTDAQGNIIPFTKDIFDPLNASCGSDVAPALSTISGAAQYYSPNNIFTDDIHRDFIPDAEGQVYTITEFTRDGTGRVARQGGLGKELAYGNGHDIQTYYGTTNNTELRRLFGSNVGKASHYQKYMSVDANGQVSVTYTDQEERTIATALIGDAPDNVEALAGVTTENIITDLTASDVLDVQNNQIVAVNKVLNSIPNTTYNFGYGMLGETFIQNISSSFGITSGSICQSCKYELSIAITDPCGGTVLMNTTSGTATQILETIESADPANCIPAQLNNLNFSVDFASIGEYTITKKLTAINDNLQAQVDAALADMGVNLNDLITQFQSEVDLTLCDFTCEDHCLTTVRELHPSLAENDPVFLAALADCKAQNCNVTTMENGIDEAFFTSQCEGMYDLMVADLTPSNSGGANGWLYDDDAFLEAQVGVANHPCSSCQTAADVRANWSDAILDFYLPFHREYCHYSNCIASGDERLFEFEMAQITTWADAVATGYANPISLTTAQTGITFGGIQEDPFAYDSPGNGNSFRGLLSNRILNYHQYSAPCPTAPVGFTGPYTLYEYLEPANSPCLYVGLSAAEIEARRWNLFQSTYNQMRTTLKNDYLLSIGCGFYQDDESINTNPLDLAAGNQIFGPIADPTTGCQADCSVNAESWLEQLPVACRDGLTPAQLEQAKTAFENYCGQVCGFENPFGFILSADNTTPEYQNLVANLAAAGITCSLTDVELNMPYEPCVNTTVYTGLVSCTDELISFINGAFLPNFTGHSGVGTPNVGQLAPFSGSYANYVVPSNLAACYDFGTASVNGIVSTSNTTIELATIVGNTVTGDCKTLFRFVDTDNNVLSFTDIASIVTYQLEAHPGLSQVNNNGLPVLKVVLLLDAGNYVEAYSALDVSTSASPCGILSDSHSSATYCIPQGLKEDFLPTLDLDEERQACIDQLMAEAEYQANEVYNQIVEDVTAQILNKYENQCFKGALDEDYTLSYPLKEYQYTLFYYDQAGNLVQTVPPQGVHPVPATSFNAAGEWNGTDEPAHTFVTNYKYNTTGQVLEQTTPDGGTSNFWYDRIDRIRFSQTAEQVNKNYYSYVKYDGQGRVVEGGESGDGLASCNAQAFTDPAVLNDYSFPQAGWEKRTTVYDDALDPAVQGIFENGQQRLRSFVAATVYQPGQRGQCIPDNDHLQYFASHFSYNPHGQVEECVQENSELTALGHRYKYIVNEFDIISGNVLTSTYQPGEVDQMIHKYEYDSDNRVTNAYTSRDGLIYEQQAEYLYHNHGPMVRSEIGQDKVQGTDYAYSIQGFLMGNNSATLEASRDMGHDGDVVSGSQLNRFNARDVMGFNLGYFDGVYKSISNPGISSSPFATPAGDWDAAIKDLYNGNIAWMTTAMLDENENADALATHANAYSYDQLHRLTQMRVFSDPTGNIGTLKNTNNFATAVDNNHYKVEISYDRNGNINTLKRNDENGVLMDDFNYHYTPNTNKLGLVQDFTLSPDHSVDIESQGIPGDPDNYLYDEIGRLIGDAQEQIESIVWKVDNKVDKVIFTAASGEPNLQFLYGADGMRIGKIVGEGDLAVTTWYSCDPSGNVRATYTEKTNSPKNAGDPWSETLELKELHLYAANRVGILNVDKVVSTRTFNRDGNGNEVVGSSALNHYSGGGLIESAGVNNRMPGLYTYECTNHLGNVLSTVSGLKFGIDTDGDVKRAEYYTADVLSYSDYYPFGMQMVGRNHNGGAYRYAFNGMEQDQEWSGDGNSYTTEFRMYDPRLGRWRSLDPLMNKFPDVSPYNAFANNPVFFVDPNGLAPVNGEGGVETVRNSDGQVVDPNGNASDFADDWYAAVGGNLVMTNGTNYQVWDAGSGTYVPGRAPKSHTIASPGYDEEKKNGRFAHFADIEDLQVGDVINETLPAHGFIGVGLTYIDDDSQGFTYLGEGNIIKTREFKGVQYADYLSWVFPASLSFKGGSRLLAWVGRSIGASKIVKIGKFCFLGGTLVHTETGQVQIQDIKAGDMVWAFNINTGEKELKRVQSTIKSTKKGFYILDLGDFEIEVTGEHPFYIEGRWVSAKDLQTGDLMTLIDGNVLELKKSTYQDSVVEVYNFEVDELNNYYVSEKGVLVHNSCDYRTIINQLTKGKNAQITVKSKEEAEALLREFLSNDSNIGGYMNTTMKRTFHPTKEASDYLPRPSSRSRGTYHWDAYNSAAKVGDHAAQGAHLQIHTFDGKVVRIFYR